MAEFLIYNKDHWMDALTPAEVKEYVKKYPKTFQAKYDGRYQRDDIVEEKEDKFYTKTLKGDLSRWPFRIVCITGLPTNKDYMRGTETKRRRFSIAANDGVITTRPTLIDAGLVDKEVIHE